MDILMVFTMFKKMQLWSYFPFGVKCSQNSEPATKLDLAETCHCTLYLINFKAWFGLLGHKSILNLFSAVVAVLPKTFFYSKLF